MGEANLWESAKLYTVRCAECKKWRLIPTKERYEEIRERILEQPFICEIAREWRPQISCETEPDVQQDGSLCWAMDKPKIPKTPSGWKRILRIRARGGTQFADVFYVTPSNKKLRSMRELERHFVEHPNDFPEGLCKSKFSFTTPTPLDKNYTTKNTPTPLDKKYTTKNRRRF